MVKVQRNHLEEWKLEHYWSSSEFNKHSRKYKRIPIEKLYNRLKLALPERFYTAGSKFATSEKSNWIHSLLAQKDHLPSIIALDDFVTLIEYIQRKGGVLLKTLNSHLFRFDRLRDFLFEVYIYRLLEMNGIPFEIKKQIGNQEVEGACAIAGTEYVFECKKIYMPELAWWELIRYLFYLVEEKLQTSKNLIAAKDGLIGVIRLNISDENEKRIGKVKNLYSKRINDFFKLFNRTKTNSVQYIHPDPEKIGSFEIIDYTEAKFRQFADNPNTYNLIFKITPPPVISSENMNHYRTVANQQFSYMQEQIITKFKNALKKKLYQHKGRRCIYFIESESTSDLTKLDLFTMPSMFEEKSIMSFVADKMPEEDILCIILKKYGFDTEPRTQFYTYMKGGNEKARSIITNLAKNKKGNSGDEPMHL